MSPNNESEILHLLKENNVILKKLRRNGIIDLWLRLIWYAVLIGLPFVLYFYILEPYFAVLGIPSEKLRLGIGGLPVFKIVQSIFGGK